tara:strand:- start:7972 stop:8454 length:483 start_codon:yes stop_codon:yes gene_type:complete
MRNKCCNFFFLNLVIVTFILCFFIRENSNAQIHAKNKTISGSGQFGGASISTPKPPILYPKRKIKSITYLAITEEKEWVNSIGKTIKGRLIAFKQGDKIKFIPPTIIKDKNVRMLIGNKTYIFPLNNLNKENREEILSLKSGFKEHYERVKEDNKKKISQ